MEQYLTVKELSERLKLARADHLQYDPQKRFYIESALFQTDPKKNII